MKKRLVYFMFVDYSQRDNKMYLVHFYNLKNFRHCFDCCTFWLSLKDFSEENQKYATELIKKLMEIGFLDNTEFKIVKNDEFREAPCFYDEVVGRIEGGENEWIFFAHSKGITNNINESVLQWVCAMYYFGLNFEEELTYQFCHLEVPRAAFYGFPFSYYEKIDLIDNDYLFVGTMYWIKTAQVRRIINANKGKIEKVADRCYAEDFPGNHVEPAYCKTHRGYAVIHNGFYDNFPAALSEYFERSNTPEEEINGFYEYYNNMIEKCIYIND